MDETRFMAEMAKARASDKHGERSVAYWQGYERGLRRQYHGDKFGTAQEHALWLSLADDGSDPSNRERGARAGRRIDPRFRPGNLSGAGVESRKKGPLERSGPFLPRASRRLCATGPTAPRPA